MTTMPQVMKGELAQSEDLSGIWQESSSPAAILPKLRKSQKLFRDQRFSVSLSSWCLFKGTTWYEDTKPKPTVKVNPQSSIYTGDTITLSCELQDMTGWGFLYYNQWFQLLKRKPANSLKVTVNNAGETVYRCRVLTRNYFNYHDYYNNNNNYYYYYTEYSEPVKITVKGLS
ncbi:hypothetical protein C0J50_7120 [Silurus asotus]|uniref:Ig-like domain-containing protein n=1 Tax=Silurus asotus TaxID=30991 RepID=A0AAD5A090_SILAS|nr:hypothetical protein C0J50_7120 [Silurus asotus]